MMDAIIFVIFLARSSTDSIFNSIQIEAAGLDMTAGAVLNLVVLGLTATLILLRRGSMFPFMVWLPFLIVSTSTVAWAPDKGAAVRLLLVFLTYACLFTIPFFLRTKFRSGAWLLKAMIYSSIVPAAIGVLEYLFFLDATGRIKSTFSHPNVFAFYLMVILGVICFLLASSTAQFKPFFRKLMIPFAVLLMSLIVLTQTRAAWIGVLLIFAAFAFFMDRRYMLVFLLLPLLLLVPSISDRLEDLGHGTEYTGQMKSQDDALNSFAWRKLMWQSAIEDAADTPLFGKGLATFAPNALVFFPLADPDPTRRGIDAHSAYVQAGYETGLVGLACYIAIYFCLVSRALRHFRRDPRGTIMILSIILAFMVANFSDNVFYYGSVNQYFWGFLGTIFAKWEMESAEAGATAFKRLYRGGMRRIGALGRP